uniref:C2H2-type domain-containing protein n=1 Tax=Ditylenchus dipsaci TaxID=166011 RepID=A0A915D6K6_9BILA
MPPREPSPLTTFAYDSGSDLNETEQPSFSREKTQLPSCFSPEYAANIYKGDRIKKLECGKCKTKVVAKLDWILFNHVNINHLKVPAFDCLICGESFCEYSGTSIKRHMKGYHSDRLDSYQDNRPFYRSQLQEMCLKYFERK